MVFEVEGVKEKRRMERRCGVDEAAEAWVKEYRRRRSGKSSSTASEEQSHNFNFTTFICAVYLDI
jgi:hypothetical protein